MKTTFTSTLTVASMALSMGLLSLSASAGQDEGQRYLIQQVQKAKQQAQASEASKQEASAIKAEECRKLLEQGKATNGS